MAEFTTANIRNIALMGHGSEGKTTLTEAMLFAAGITDRQGKVEDGTTVSDFDPEEKKRGFSISASYAPIAWDGKVINVIDVRKIAGVWNKRLSNKPVNKKLFLFCISI